jgi:hypothetical protein
LEMQVHKAFEEKQFFWYISHKCRLTVIILLDLKH